jgi:hypothetical protein
MDWVRSCYTTRMRFWTQTTQSVPIRWVFAQPGAKALPFPHLFASANWAQDKAARWDGIGEVPGIPRPWSNGRSEAPLPGDHYCGTAEQFFNGEPLPPFPQPPIDAFDRPTCCRQADQLTLLIGGNPTVQQQQILFFRPGDFAVQSNAPVVYPGGWFYQQGTFAFLLDRGPVDSLTLIGAVLDVPGGAFTRTLGVTQFYSQYLDAGTVPAGIWTLALSARRNATTNCNVAVSVNLAIFDATLTVVKRILLATGPIAPARLDPLGQIRNWTGRFAPGIVTFDTGDVLGITVGYTIHKLAFGPMHFDYTLFDSGAVLPLVNGAIEGNPATCLTFPKPQ